jgi:hypothetical protein
VRSGSLRGAPIRRFGRNTRNSEIVLIPQGRALRTHADSRDCRSRKEATARFSRLVGCLEPRPNRVGAVAITRAVRNCTEYKTCGTFQDVVDSVALPVRMGTQDASLTTLPTRKPLRLRTRTAQDFLLGPSKRAPTGSLGFLLENPSNKRRDQLPSVARTAAEHSLRGLPVRFGESALFFMYPTRISRQPKPAIVSPERFRPD